MLKNKPFAILCVAAVVMPGAADAVVSKGAIDLAPHRAVYNMKMDSSRQSVGVAGVNARMVFEFAGSNCDGYTMNMRLRTQVYGSAGTSIVTDVQSSTWEQGAGKRYRFNSRHYRDDKLQEKISGDAERTNDKVGVAVRVSEPEPKDIHVAKPVLFPTQHSLAIIAAAKRGERVYQAHVYDGSSKAEMAFQTTAFIGKTIPAGRPAKKGADKDNKRLAKLESWPVSISYFDPEKTEQTPEYEVSFRLYENGVSRDLLIDYGDFAMRGELSRLEFIPADKCE